MYFDKCYPIRASGKDGPDKTSNTARIATLLCCLSIAMTGLVLEPHPAHSESMKAAVKRAVRHHPTGLAARENVRAVANELEETRSQFNPRVQLFSDIGLEAIGTSTSNGGDQFNTPAQVGLAARLALFDGYERANNFYRNAARLDGSLYSLLAASETIALNAVEAYIDVVRHRQLLSIARANIKRHRTILGQIKQRVAGGKSPASDRFQIEERVLAAEAVEVEIEKALQEANAKYRKVMGRKPRGKMRIPRVKKIPRSVNALVNSAIANNVEIKTGNKAISESEYARDAARGGHAPKLFLEGRTSAGIDRGSASNDGADAYVGLKFSWDIYDGGQTDARVESLAARAGEAAYRRDLKVREIREAAELSWSSYIQGSKRTTILAKQLKTNKRIVSNYREEYELSKRSLLDVLDAERARFNSHFQLISVAASYRYAPFRMLATKSRLAAYFGAANGRRLAKPTFERRAVRDPGGVFPKGIFNINIEPLK